MPLVTLSPSVSQQCMFCSNITASSVSRKDGGAAETLRILSSQICGNLTFSFFEDNFASEIM